MIKMSHKKPDHNFETAPDNRPKFRPSEAEMDPLSALVDLLATQIVDDHYRRIKESSE